MIPDLIDYWDLLIIKDLYRAGFIRHISRIKFNFSQCLFMKSKLLLTISVGLSSFLITNAQVNNNSTKQSSGNLDELSFRVMVNYIYSDTQILHVAEIEKNTIPHFGEEHRLVTPILANPGVFEQDNSSYDKFLPSVYNKEVTQGSPFLTPVYVPGLVLSQSYGIINKPGYLYNYDKMSGNLLLKRENESPIAVYRENVISFCLKLDKGGFIFTRVPLINSNEYFQVIYKGLKYSSYKLYKNIFINANQKTNGYVTEGKDYDEYQDIETYYVVDEKKEEWTLFELSKKSIRKTFPSESAILDQFFKNHRYEDITESYVANLLEALNK
jgi:hypothetical protein